VRALAGALLLLGAAHGTLPAQDSATTLLDRATARYRAARTVRAPFTQTLTNPLTQTTRSARGELMQQGRQRFALRFTDPAGDAIVSDGRFVWMYLPSTARGQVIKMPLAAGAGLDFIAGLLSSPREHYAVATRADEPVDAHRAAVYELTPRSENTPFTRATLWIGRDDALLWQLETVEPSGLVRRVRFSAVHLDARLPAGALEFALPPGVRIVDQQALMGGGVGAPRKP
jgi:outer membrane lipoprotein carrier protein